MESAGARRQCTSPQLWWTQRPANVEIELIVQAGGLDVLATAARIASERTEAEAAADRVGQAAREVARQLHAAGLTRDDIATVVGLSRSRVAQLLR